MKKIFLFFISFSIGIGLFFLAIKWVGLDPIKKSFVVFGHWEGLLVFFLTFLTFLVSTWKWQIILKALGQELNFKDFFQVYLAGFSIRYFVPVAIFFSEIFQAESLKEIHKISWSKSLASVIIERVSELTINVIIILFSFLIFLFKIGLYHKNFWLLPIIFLFLISSFIFYFYLKIIKKESIIARIVNFLTEKRTRIL